MPKPKPIFKVQHTTLPIEKINPSPYNPRKITPEAREGLKTSLDRFGLVQEIVVNKRTMNVVGGNQRFGLLKEQGAKEVPVALVDLTEDEEKALNVSLNNPKIQGEFTGDLKGLLEKLDAALVQGLRTDELSKSLEEQLAEADEEFSKEFTLEPIAVAPPPKAVWALVVVPAEKFHEVSGMLEQVSRVEGVIYDQIIR